MLRVAVSENPVLPLANERVQLHSLKGGGNAGASNRLPRAGCHIELLVEVDVRQLSNVERQVRSGHCLLERAFCDGRTVQRFLNELLGREDLGLGHTRLELVQSIQGERVLVGLSHSLSHRS